jgi:protease-4
MKKFLVTVLAIIGALTVLVVMAGGAAGLIAMAGKGSVSDRTILEIDFEKGIIETVPDDPIGSFFKDKVTTLRDVVDALEKGGADPKVAGLVARIGEAPMGVADIQEIRDAVLRFRKAGKPAVAWGETFGEFAPGNRSYYLASAFEEIWLQPSGDVGLTGLMAESPFLKGTFDKVGLVPRMDHRYEYKNAMNMYTETKYTPAHREATGKVIDSLFGQIVKGIGEGRKLSPDEVKARFDAGPYLGKEALEARLVDGMAYRDEFYEKAKAKLKAGSKAKFLSLPAYLDRAGRPNEKGTRIALIYGLGGVQRGKSKYDPMQDSQSMGSDTVAGAFRAAIEDKEVKAILFRVDSPGGSYVASDTIWRETVRAKAAGKPVIVSMGNVAGSGGYFVAMAADKIVAEPGTITGSIGVLGGKFLTNGLWEKLGLSWDELHTSKNATMFSGTHDYTPEEWARFQAWLDRVYVDFTSKVAAGRKLPREKVLEIARGRIWSGEDAKAIGLVDELGGMPAALKLARAAAKVPADGKVELKVFPARKTPFEAIFNRDSGEREAAVELATRTLEAVRPAVRAARLLGVGGEGVLRMPVEEIAP